MPGLREGPPAWWLGPLGTGHFLFLSQCQLFLLNQRCSIPSLMTWNQWICRFGAGSGAYLFRGQHWLRRNVILGTPKSKQWCWPSANVWLGKPAAFWDPQRAGALWFLTFEQGGRKDLLESFDSRCGGGSKFRIKWPLHLQTLLRPRSTEGDGGRECYFHSCLIKGSSNFF